MALSAFFDDVILENETSIVSPLTTDGGTPSTEQQSTFQQCTKTEAAWIDEDDYGCVKVLVGHFTTGTIIGKNGSNVSDIQHKHGASIKFSSTKEFYPGTNERIMTIRGTTDSILHTIEHVSEYLSSDTIGFKSTHISLKILVPKLAVGAIIGRNGELVKRLQEATSTEILFVKTSPDHLVLRERLCIISGSISAVIQTLRAMFPKFREDKFTTEAATMPCSLPSRNTFPPIASTQVKDKRDFFPRGDIQTLQDPLPRLPFIPCNYETDDRSKNEIDAPLQKLLNLVKALESRPRLVKFNSSVEIWIPLSAASAILGRNGSTLAELETLTDTQIELLELDPLTFNRKARITGALGGMTCALIVLVGKIQQHFG